jgi:predicted outer membrane repeat protein
LKTLTSISKRTRRIAAVAALLLLVASAAIGAVAAGNLNLGSLAGAALAGSTCNVPSGGTYIYPTIQAAVNDAGCATINVAAGAYYENVTIGRAVTINGAGASSTIVDGGGTNCILWQCTKSVFTVNQPVAVTFSGLTIKNGYNGSESGAYPTGASGGIQISAPANVTVTNSILSNNHAFNYYGGAICLCHPNGTLTVRNSTFSGNVAPTGGAIWNWGDATVINSTFFGNRSMEGGAIHVYKKIYLSGNTFYANEATSGSAVFVNLSSEATIINSTFYNNQRSGSKSKGGAIYSKGTVNLSSSTFSGNGATEGGAIFSDNGNISLKSTIIASNAGGNCSGAGFNDSGNNLRWPSNDSSCVGIFGDPKLAALADNGGATQTIALQAGSAAIDVGACSDTNGATITTDQRGSTRPQGWTCDIGAVESSFKVLRAGLVAHWKLDEGSGTTANDSSSNGRTGTLVNGASFTNAALPALQFTDPFALALTGSSHQYVDAGTSLNLANASFTVAGWAKRSTTAGKQWIVGQGTRNTDRALVLGFRDNDRFTCAFYDDDLDTPNQYLDTNEWHHWACTFDGATRARQIYRDGVLVASDTSKGMFQASGAFNFGRAAWDEGYFSGALDDMRVYNRALSASEVQWLATGNP